MDPENNFTTCLEKLYRKNINQFLDLVDKDNFDFSEIELRFLINSASILSLSEEKNDISLAYEICSRLIELYGESKKEIVMAADIILSRVGNFPGRELLRYKFFDNSQPIIPIALAVERLARESENSIGENSLVTDFQYKLYISLDTQRSLSVSAPTSAGKSYILNLDLVRRLRKEAEPCIVYIVPTRALVSEVVFRVRTTLRAEEVENVVVRTAPFPVLHKEKYNGIVYVLTQERLLRLLSFSKDLIGITSLIVDEAHELQKGKRGILLQNGIDSALKKFPDISVFFASPLINNPGYLLEVFDRSKSGLYFTEEVSPVSQNVILVSEINKNPYRVKCQLLLKNSTISIGEANLNFQFRKSKISQIAHFAVEICKLDESVIVFADDPEAAEKSAEVITSIVEEVQVSEEIDDFINFIKSEIHPEYPLVSSLRKGVAFHYGNMPSIVRNGVERFFREGKIRFLCSTSTLLQGVNLPAKHIVIENPHLGEFPMGRADFRNLAGRAGRLLKEFHGNVWCLRPGQWDSECYHGEYLQEIKSAMGQIMEDGGTSIQVVVNSTNIKENDELVDAAYSRLYHEVMENGKSGTFSNYQNDENQEVLSSNIEHMSKLKINVPLFILESHRSIRPDLLQRLYDELRSKKSIEAAILISPYEAGGKARMQAAIADINFAFGIVMSDKYFNLVSGLAHNWSYGKPVGELISERIVFVRKNKPHAKASPQIRSLLKTIETVIRYKLVKYFAAYEDLLRQVLIERGSESQVAPYHIYLEFGSADQIALNLMALGLSRFTAIKLKTLTNWTDAQEPEEFLSKISNLNLNKLSLPKLCKQEIYDLLGTVSN